MSLKLYKEQLKTGMKIYGEKGKAVTFADGNALVALNVKEKAVKEFFESEKSTTAEKAFNSEDKKEIFIRLSTKKEQESPSEKKKAFQSIPEKNGYEIVYKPWGSQGRGFYYLEK